MATRPWLSIDQEPDAVGIPIRNRRDDRKRENPEFASASPTASADRAHGTKTVDVDDGDGNQMVGLDQVGRLHGMGENQALRELRVLIVEDEYLIADDLREVLQAAGARSVQLSGGLQDALVAVTRCTFDVALLDIDLRGEQVYDVADMLVHRRVPFAFLTGFDREMLPQRFVLTPVWGKPFDTEKLVNGLGILGSRRVSTHQNHA